MNVFDPNMVLQSFWGSLGLLWGALGGLFGASRSTKDGLQIHLGTLVALVCSPLAAEDGLGSVVGRLWLCGNLLGSILIELPNQPSHPQN